MQDKVEMFRGARDKARAAGDRALEAAMIAELQRMGIVDDPPMETAVPAPLETAVPVKGGRRRPPRRPAEK